MVMDEERGTGWWLDSGEAELVEQQGWIPLSLWRVFLMSVRRWGVWLIPQGVKHMAEEILWYYYDVAVSASSVAKWWCLLAAKQCLLYTLCCTSLIRPCCAILELSAETLNQTTWIMFHKNSLITALSRGLTLLLGVSWKFNIREFLL